MDTHNQSSQASDASGPAGKPKTGLLDRAPAKYPARPTGPYVAGDGGRAGSLLLFVPRNPISTMIDELSGGYGYSHLAVDCGEVDLPTGKPVMIESTVGDGVHYAFQDEYGERHFARLPLEKVGVAVEDFCRLIHSKLGEKYDDEEALTLGLIDDPAKQICSDLATVCLPPETLSGIAHAHRQGLFHPASAIVHGDPDGKFRLFVSPNGFAEYFGAPQGHRLAGPDQLVEPALPDGQAAPRSYPRYWQWGLALVGCLALAWLAIRTWRRRSAASALP